MTVPVDPSASYAFADAMRRLDELGIVLHPQSAFSENFKLFAENHRKSLLDMPGARENVYGRETILRIAQDSEALREAWSSRRTEKQAKAENAYQGLKRGNTGKPVSCHILFWLLVNFPKDPNKITIEKRVFKDKTFEEFFGFGIPNNSLVAEQQFSEFLASKQRVQAVVTQKGSPYDWQRKGEEVRSTPPAQSVESKANGASRNLVKNRVARDEFAIQLTEPIDEREKTEILPADTSIDKSSRASKQPTLSGTDTPDSGDVPIGSGAALESRIEVSSLRAETQIELELPPRRYSPSDDIESKLRFDLEPTRFYGREKEQGLLRRFVGKLKDECNFGWMQIAGSAGQGKSRLALHLARELHAKGWNAGFLPANRLQHALYLLQNWIPDKPHFFIVDYVLGHEESIGCLIESLSQLEGAIPPQRLILIERQRWDRGGTSHKSVNENGNIEFQLGKTRAAWFEKLSEGNRLVCEKHAMPIVELERMSDDELAQIVDEYAGNTLALPRSEVLRRLSRMDASGRPLFALILADALASNRLSETIDWSQEEALDYIITKNRKKRWKEYFQSELPDVSSDNPILRAALIATLVRGLSKSDLQKILGEHYSPESHKQVLVIQDAPIGLEAAGASRIVPPLEPDLLGGWMILQAARGTVDMSKVLADAWRVSPKDTSSSLRRVNEDYFGDKHALGLFDLRPESEEARDLCASTATQVFASVWDLNYKFDESQVTLLRRAAKNEDGLAQVLLGLTARHLQRAKTGVQISKEMSSSDDFTQKLHSDGAVTSQTRPRWISRKIIERIKYLIENSNTSAVLAISSWILSKYARLSFADTIFQTAREVESRETEMGDGLAKALLRVACKHQHADAIFYLARKIEDDNEVSDENRAHANQLYQKAVDLGHTDAMFFLASNLQDGLGVAKSDAAAANELYEMASERGDLNSTFNLALNMQHGIGLKTPDPKKGNELLRVGADGGDASAMFVLALNLQQVVGVAEPDYLEARSLLEDAVKLEHPGATFVLAHNLEHGIAMDKPDPERAQDLRSRMYGIGLNHGEQIGGVPDRRERDGL